MYKPEIYVWMEGIPLEALNRRLHKWQQNWHQQPLDITTRDCAVFLTTYRGKQPNY